MVWFTPTGGVVGGMVTLTGGVAGGMVYTYWRCDGWYGLHLLEV